MQAIALVGNPNCGKTTLLNALTGASFRVGNWPGVTVERKQARLELPGGAAMLIDLPGIYSLTPYSVEEKVALAYLTSGEPDLILNVVDATNLERNLYLTLGLKALGLPMVVALNLMDALKGGGGSIDEGALSKALGVPVVPVSAFTHDGFEKLLRHLRDELDKPTGKRPISWQSKPESVDLLAQATAKYAAIERALGAARFVPPQQSASRLDRICLHRVWAYPVFLGIMAAIFGITFGPVGSALTHLCEQLIALMAVGAKQALGGAGAPPLLRSLVLDGALAGVGGVLCFLPQILLLFGFLSVLEDTGYMARAAFIADRPLRALGLSGRAFIPMLMGFGCTTTAAVAARSVDDERDRRITILLLPFMSCGAKLPVYALFAAAFFAAHQSLLVLGLYALGMLMMALTGSLLKRALPTADAPFVLELPPYRLPEWTSVRKRLGMRAKDFIARAGTLIFVMSMVIWFLQSFTPTLRWAETGQDSLFGQIGCWLSPLFAPLGFGDWRKCVALLSGLVAKEAVVSTLTVLYRAGDAHLLGSILPQHFGSASAAAFLVFTLLYPPCLSALAAMRRELGSRKLLLLSIAIQTGAAYLAALAVYQIGSLF